MGSTVPFVVSSVLAPAPSDRNRPDSSLARRVLKEERKTTEGIMGKRTSMTSLLFAAGLVVAASGCSGSGTICDQAADHFASCTGQTPPATPPCDAPAQAAARDLLSKECAQLSGRTAASLASRWDCLWYGSNSHQCAAAQQADDSSEEEDCDPSDPSCDPQAPAPTVQVTGTVTTEDGAALSWAGVRLCKPTGWGGCRQALTGKHGEFTINDVPADIYRITVIDHNSFPMLLVGDWGYYGDYFDRYVDGDTYQLDVVVVSN